jgi:hypothetical protein
MLLALPAILLLQSFWTFGELLGYVTGKTGGPPPVESRTQTDSCDQSQS